MFYRMTMLALLCVVSWMPATAAQAALIAAEDFEDSSYTAGTTLNGPGQGRGPHPGIGRLGKPGL